MSLLRRVLAVLLASCLVAAPVAARALPGTSVAATGHSQQMSSMPNCDGMVNHAAAGQPAGTKSGHKHCPGCAQDGSCSGDACQLKCFKVLAALTAPARLAAQVPEHFGWVQQAALVTLNLTPPPPPPRA